MGLGVSHWGLASHAEGARDYAAAAAPAGPTAPASPQLAAPAETATPIPTPSSDPAQNPDKPSSSATPDPAGAYPYPLDAGPSVSSGTLSLDPGAVQPGATTEVTVTASSEGWVPGQEIFVYLGQRYQLTLSGPGASGELTVTGGEVGSGGVTVSGFQFPGDSTDNPVDGAGNATLRSYG